MTGRHRPPRTKRALKARMEALSADLDRSESVREALLKSRNDLQTQVQRLDQMVRRLQRELGSEDHTVPVDVVRTDKPLALLRSPLVPVQRPDGTRYVAQTGQNAVRPSQGRTSGNRPRWASG